jgi:hypothetical protein
MASGGDTLKRYLTSVISHNYLYTLEVNHCGGQAVYDEWTKCKCQGEEVEGRRPDRPRSKCLEKVSKDDGSTGIRR